MKRFLPLFILTGLLFGQDLLLLKSGKFYKNVTYTKDLYLYNYALDPKVLYYDKGELTKTEYISRETGEVIKVTRIWRMKRHMKRIFLNIASFYSNTPNLQRGVGEIKK